VLGTSLAYDWPPPPHFRASVGRSDAFEDRFAPDAFGVQLLGPGYAGRVPDGTEWRQTSMDAGSVMLEHIDPGAWFDAAFAPFGGIANPTNTVVDVPDVLAAGREAFAPILFRDDVPASQ
jgi:hypothetical protein